VGGEAFALYTPRSKQGSRLAKRNVVESLSSPHIRFCYICFCCVRLCAEIKCEKQQELISTMTSDGDHHWNNLNNAHFHGIKCVFRVCVCVCVCVRVYVCVCESLGNLTYDSLWMP